MTLVRVTRKFPFRGATYTPGSEIDVPQATAERMAAARPPFGIIVAESELEELTRPDPQPETAGGSEPEPRFTEGAIELLNENDLGAGDYDGPIEGGVVSKGSVRVWLEGRSA